MQLIVGHRPELRLVVNYIEYWSAVDSFQWNIESTLKLNYEEVGTFMSSNGLNFDLIYHDDIIYEDWIGFRFIFMHKSDLVIM